MFWGGTDVDDWLGLNSGGRYDASSNIWLYMPETGGPNSRFGSLNLWTGDRMVVYGGLTTTDAPQSGAIYDPVNDAWSPVSTFGAPFASKPTGAWTGTEVFVWGDTGPALYDPEANVWRVPNSNGALSARSEPMVVWTGKYVVVWGGRSIPSATEDEIQRRDGAMYDPVTDRWSAMEANGSPSARMGRAVWAGDAMIVWGGSDGISVLNDGAAFYPPH
jgi:hypothetical protein